MWKNYLRIGFRNLFRNGSTTFIHIAGLTIGVVCTLLIFFYVDFERSYEKMHAEAHRIFRLSIDMYDGNEFIANDSQTYQLIGQELKDQYPEVEEFVRLFPNESIEMVSNSTNFKSYEYRTYFADSTIFDVFSLNILNDQNLESFSEPFKLVISESTAIKYFGKTDVLGESLEPSQAELPLEIVGVFEDLPMNTHIKYDLLISHETLPLVQQWYPENLWNANNEYTYLLMQEGINVEDFNAKLAEYSERHPQIESEVVISEGIKDIHLYSNKTYEPEVNGSAQTVNFMFFIGLIIIALAWINYINLATAKAMDRAKEVGIRKAIGSSKKQLVFQFFAEAFLVNFISTLLALLIFSLVFPAFREFVALDISINNFGNLKLAAILVGFVLIGTVVSGFYPALVLSSFNPVTVLKGKFSNTTKGILLRKSLVYVQFTASVVLLCVSFAVFKQMKYLTSQDLGIGIDNTLVVKVPQLDSNDSIEVAKSTAFQSELIAQSWISDITMSGSLPGDNTKDMSSSSGITQLGQDEETDGILIYHYGIQANFPEVMGLEFLAGEAFRVDSPKEEVIISERTAELLGFATPEDAVNERINFYWSEDGEPSYIKGVFKNYYQRSPKEQYMPLLLRNQPSTDHFLIKLNTNNAKMAVADVGETIEKVYPGASYEYHFLNDTYNTQYQQDNQFGSVVLLFTLLSILIAILGLFGLSSFMIRLRTKEIGVRTVLGASKSSLVWELSKSFLIMVGTAGLIAVPLSYFLVNEWLQNYATRFIPNWDLFTIPLIFILLVAAATVGIQTLKSALANPVDSLKAE
ncbi:ABC transporter permease [Algoriphagus sediminis]|uniref:ABC transporter permease n=1 Tax=Algoriphagus sediminis TaxID=3057113 RepID=A0ABT7Y9Y2_9BACT|nr:ABC transporter permease [Algoriphagus sediminis]MDN3203320.1 ABC transporter permease [Algoriphagus sediminis]